MASPGTRTEPTTAADLLRLPDDGHRYEPVAGQLRPGGRWRR